MDKKTGLWLTLAFSLIYLGTIWYRPLFTSDETRYAEIAREMIAHNDWVLPQLNNLRYFEKPVMGHWLNVLSMCIFGQNEFAVRFSSALAVLLSAYLLGILIKKYQGDKLWSTWSQLVFLSSSLVFAVGTYAVLDAPLTFFLTATLVSFFLAWREKKFWHKNGYLALTGIACGCAFMTKGFLAFVVPALVIGVFLCWERRWKELFTLSWIPLLFTMLTCAPWAVMVHLEDGDFWRYFVVVEHLQRFIEKENSQHPQPFWFFIPILIVGIVPWILLLPSIIRGYRGKINSLFQDALLRYFACWAVLPFIFFSLSSGKLATYILPCFPAIAALIAYGLLQQINDNSEDKYFKVLLKIIIYCFVLAIVSILVAQLLMLLKITPLALYDNSEWGKLSLGIIAVVGWILLLHIAIKSPAKSRQYLWFISGSMLAMLVVHFIVPNHVLAAKAPEKFLLAQEHRIRPETTIVCYKNLITAVCWYYKRDNVFIYSRGGELEYGLSHPEAQGRLLSEDDFAALVKNPENHVVIIMDSKRLMKELPEGDFKIWKNSMLFQEYNTP